MKPRYYRAGLLIWKFVQGASEMKAFVRILDSQDGWSQSKRDESTMKMLRAVEITAKEGEP